MEPDSIPCHLTLHLDLQLEELHSIVHRQLQQTGQDVTAATLPLHLSSGQPRPPPLFQGQAEAPANAPHPSQAWWLSSPGLNMAGACSLPVGNNYPFPTEVVKQVTMPSQHAGAFGLTAVMKGCAALAWGHEQACISYFLYLPPAGTLLQVALTSVLACAQGWHQMV